MRFVSGDEGAELAGQGVAEDGLDVTDCTDFASGDSLAAFEPGGVEELVVSDADHSVGGAGGGDDFVRFVGVQGQRFLDIDMAAVFEEFDRESMMRMSGGRNVDDVRADFVEHALMIGVLRWDAEARGSLMCEVRVDVADGDHACAVGLGDLLQMGVGDLAAADQGDAQGLCIRVHGGDGFMQSGG
ncbi:MAG: hypothetical protein U0992_12465 [Planctomycetaceae bacterium]